MDVGQHFLFTTPLTPIRETSSRRFTIIFVMGLPNFQARPSPPLTCVPTPNSTQVAPCRGRETNSKVLLQKRRRRRRGSSYQRPLYALDGQYLRHVWDEYGRPLIPFQNPDKRLETAKKEEKRKYLDA